VIERPSDPATIERLRASCLGLPDVMEKLSHGEPTWFARGRSFAMTADHHHDDRLAYVGVRGWVGVYLDVAVDWDELAGLIADAHATVLEQRRATVRGR
jgi:hypothetical protein